MPGLLSQALPSISSWQFLVLLFVINCLGELGVPFPLVLAGVIAVAGYELSQGNLIAGLSTVSVSLVGSITGAMLLYGLARWSGRARWLRPPAWLQKTRLWRSADKRGVDLSFTGIVHARLVPGLALPVSILAGVMHVPVARVLAGVALSEAVWLTPVLAIGYAMGLTALELDGLAARIPAIVALAAGALLVLRLVLFLWRRSRPAVGV